MDSYNSPTTKPLFKGTQIVWFLLWFIETMLIFRFVFKLMGANSGAWFTDFIYTVTWPFVAPFLAVFPIGIARENVFDWTALLAMAVYWIVALAIIKSFLMSKTVSIREAAAGLDDQQ